MDKLQAMQLFTRVVDTGSFTAAAEQLGISRALASKLIQNLEDTLGVRLLNRTRRRLSLTESGQNYYQRVSDVLMRLGEAEAEATELQVDPRGRLRHPHEGAAPVHRSLARHGRPCAPCAYRLRETAGGRV